MGRITLCFALARKRRNLGLTMKDVAEGMCVDIRTVYNIEHGFGPESSLRHYQLYLKEVERDEQLQEVSDV